MMTSMLQILKEYFISVSNNFKIKSNKIAHSQKIHSFKKIKYLVIKKELDKKDKLTFRLKID